MKLLLLSPLLAVPWLFSDKSPSPELKVEALAQVQASPPWTAPFDGFRLVAEAILPNPPDALTLNFKLYGNKKDPVEALAHLEAMQKKLLDLLKGDGINDVRSSELLYNDNVTYSSKSSYLSSSSSSRGLGLSQGFSCQVADLKALLPLLPALEKAELPAPQISPFWKEEKDLRQLALMAALGQAREQCSLLDIQQGRAFVTQQEKPLPRPIKSLQILAIGPIETPHGPRLHAKIEVVFAIEVPMPVPAKE